MLIFEYDPNKSAKTVTKHVINFEAAQALWDDDSLLELPAKKKTDDRFLIIAVINKKHGTAIITYRGDQLRIISVRRSRTSEVDAYES